MGVAFWVLFLTGSTVEFVCSEVRHCMPDLLPSPSKDFLGMEADGTGPWPLVLQPVCSDHLATASPWA